MHIRLLAMLMAAFLVGMPASAQTVFPSGDDSSSDEQDRDDAGSGFDTDGGFAIPQDDYDDGDNGDGTWTPEVPDASDPEPVDTDEEDD